MQTTSQYKDTFEGIVVPPGCDNPMLHDCGEKVSTYIPNSYTPFQASNLPNLIPHAMHGKSGGVSVPKNNFPVAEQSMATYLSHFKGAYLCLDFWMDSNVKIKKCGILSEIGNDFIVLNDTQKRNYSVIDLKPVRYINIYCR